MHPVDPSKLLAKTRAKGEFWFSRSISASLPGGIEGRYIAIACDGSGYVLADSWSAAIDAARVQFPGKDAWVRQVRSGSDGTASIANYRVSIAEITSAAGLQ